MLNLALALTCCWAAAEPLPAGTGEISGVVVNASQRDAACPQAEVMLRAKTDEDFVLVAETTADSEGRFHFGNLPIGRKYVYLPGANRDSVHYPGSRLQLNAWEPHARCQVKVHDTIQEPSPLVAVHHEIVIQPEQGVLRVTESMLVRNPTASTYVGQPPQEGAAPVTLRLSVPSTFERTTFHQEFYGRRFAIADGQLVTSIPWTPGERDLRFTYTLRSEDLSQVWQRPLDLPTEHLRVRVIHDQPDQVTCNLDSAYSAAIREQAFDSKGETLPAGYVLRVQLGNSHVPWTTYARWGALAVLLGSVAVAGGVWWRQRRVRRAPAAAETASESPAPTHVIAPPSAAYRQAARRQQRRAVSS